MTLFEASTWVIPVIIAVTFHEAIHGFVARMCGDDTAWRLGRVSFNPLKHIDPFGTILLPAMLLMLHSPFLFGYAKPVPVNFKALRHPRRDMVLVAAAGPGMNLALATLAALAFHLVVYLPEGTDRWVGRNLGNALVINVLLAVFIGGLMVGRTPEWLGKKLEAREVKIHLQQAVSLTFSIKYLTNFAKSTPLSNYVKVGGPRILVP